MLPLSAENASQFATIALAHIEREYPYHPAHLLTCAADLKPPRQLHPIFFGSFDWHSCVHAHWLLARVLRLQSNLPQTRTIIDLFNVHFTPENVEVELAYFKQPARGAFERPYGWAWLLKLAAELSAGRSGASAHDSLFKAWAKAIAPLANHLAGSLISYLPKAPYPTRVGTHTNSAFALRLALDYAHDELRSVLSAKAASWYLKDRAAPAWEPDATDFLSPTLQEAELMRHILPPWEFLNWLDDFLPNLAQQQPATLFTPATVSDRVDGQLAHLDGLNLSRAWCWNSIARALPDHDPRRALIASAADRHLDAALPHLAVSYAGEHWLATFALLAITE